MYQVIWKESETSNHRSVVHEPNNYGNKLSEGQLELSLEGLGVSTFECTINIRNALYGKTKPLTNMIEVYDSRGGKVFHGRVAKITKSMSSQGEFAEKVLCEDRKSYLYDSTQRYMKPTLMSVSSYLGKLLDAHNSQVDDHKRIYSGNVTVQDDEPVYRGIGYGKTADMIKDKLLDRLGGYLILREANGRLVLDYLKDYGQTSTTPLQIARNLRSASRDIDISELATRIVPLGQDIEQDQANEEVGSDYSRPKHEITDVNGGRNYLEDTALVNEFGVIQKTVDFPNTTNHTILKAKGESYLRAQRLMLISWTVEVIELGLIDRRYELIQLGNSYPVENPVLYGRETLQVVEKKVDILNPQRITLTIGSSKKTLSNFQLEYAGFQTSLSDVVSRLEQQRATNTNTTNQLASLSEQLELSKVALNQAQEEVNRTNKLLEEAETKIGNNTTLLDETKRNSEEQAKLLADQIRALQKEIEELKKGR